MCFSFTNSAQSWHRSAPPDGRAERIQVGDYSSAAARAQTSSASSPMLNSTQRGVQQSVPCWQSSCRKHSGGGATWTHAASKQICPCSGQSVSSAHSGNTSMHRPSSHARSSPQSRSTRHSGGGGKQRVFWQVLPSGQSSSPSHRSGATQVLPSPRVQMALSQFKPAFRPRLLPQRQPAEIALFSVCQQSFLSP